MDEIIRQKIHSLILEIPKGKVATYGQLALLAGYPGRARMAGKVLSSLTRPSGMPCYRVVGSGGRLVAGWDMQRVLLEQEGVTFSPAGKVNMKLHAWSVI